MIFRSQIRAYRLAPERTADQIAMIAPGPPPFTKNAQEPLDDPISSDIGGFSRIFDDLSFADTIIQVSARENSGSNCHDCPRASPFHQKCVRTRLLVKLTGKMKWQSLSARTILCNKALEANRLATLHEIFHFHPCNL